MGLQSGLLWADSNVGTDDPEGYGTFFEWSEIEVTPEGWQSPTKEQFEELLESCVYQILTYNGVRGLLLVSTVNGNKLFFPMSGVVSENGSVGQGYYVALWTATEGEDSEVYVALYNGQTFEVETVDQAQFTCPVRAVKVQ